jgi:hypothetical protein
LIEEFREIFPDVELDCITADREFIGEDWFDYLLNQILMPLLTIGQINRIRIRHSDLLFDGQRYLNAKVGFSHLKSEEQQVLKCRRRVWGHWVYVSALRLKDNDLLVIVTLHRPKIAIANHGKRWGIETLFGCLKTRDFCLESTHLQDPERLEWMVALLTLALCWAFRTGEWLSQHQPIKIKKHGRKSKSILLLGLDYLQRIFLNLNSFETQSLEAIKLLSGT